MLVSAGKAGKSETDIARVFSGRADAMSTDAHALVFHSIAERVPLMKHPDA